MPKKFYLSNLLLTNIYRIQITDQKKITRFYDHELNFSLARAYIQSQIKANRQTEVIGGEVRILLSVLDENTPSYRSQVAYYIEKMERFTGYDEAMKMTTEKRWDSKTNLDQLERLLVKKKDSF